MADDLPPSSCFGQVAGQGDCGFVLTEAVVLSGGRLPRPQHVLVDSCDDGRFVRLDKRAPWLTMLVAGKSHTRCVAPLGEVFEALSEACLQEHLGAEILDDPVLALADSPSTKLPARPASGPRLRSWQASLETLCKPWITRVRLGPVLDALRRASGLPEASAEPLDGSMATRELNASFRCERLPRCRTATRLRLSVRVGDLKDLVCFLHCWAAVHRDPAEVPELMETPKKQRRRSRDCGEASAGSHASVS